MRSAIIAAVFTLTLAGCSKYPSGTLVFVTNERAGTISVIEAASNKIAGTIVTGARPRGIRISADGARAYVALSTPLGKPQRSADSRVAVIDTSNGAIRKFVNVGDDPEQIAVDARQKFLYVSNEDSGTATVTDIDADVPAATLITGIEPEGMAISPDGKWVYVMSETSSTVTVIDTAGPRVVTTFMVGARPRDAAFSPDGTRAYVTAEVGRTLTVVDTSTHTPIAQVPIGFTDSSGPVGVVVSPDGSRIYIANGRGNSVSILDSSDFHLISRIPVGQRVWGIGLSADGKLLYAANGLSNDISVINTDFGRVVATIPCGDGPWGVAIRNG